MAVGHPIIVENRTNTANPRVVDPQIIVENRTNTTNPRVVDPQIIVENRYQEAKR